MKIAPEDHPFITDVTAEFEAAYNGDSSEREPPGIITARPFIWRDPRTIPPRQWLYGKHYIRKFVSATVAPPGIGKSSLSLVEAVSMATGLALLGVSPLKRRKVWLWNLEDPYEEIERRLGAVLLHFQIEPSEIEGSIAGATTLSLSQKSARIPL